LAGDIVDLGSISRFPSEPDVSIYVVDEMKYAASEINALHGYKVLIDGNHEARWSKALIADKAPQFHGAKGLTFSEQMYAQGLDRETTKWVFETPTNHGLFLGRGDATTLIRHGDHQHPRGGKHVAASVLDRSPHYNIVIGHVHRAQMFCKTSVSKTRFSIANPTMKQPQPYAKDGDWQMGFTVLRFYGGTTLRKCKRVTPQVVLMHSDGSFCVDGNVYD
jgi:hypothetical protein